MKSHRFWIEIVLLGSVVAFLLALLIASLGAAAGAGAPENESARDNPTTPVNAGKPFTGMVTCSRCEAKHSAALDRSSSICVLVCVHGGANFALVSADSSGVESTYLLEGNWEALKKLAGQRARIVGTRKGHIITVISATAQT